MNVKSGIFIFFIILLVVAAVFYWAGVRPSIAPLERDKGGSAPLSGEKDSVFVEDQAPAINVRITKLTLSEDGWVVIHDEREEKPGIIIAAARFDAGTYENRDVDLLGKTTEEGKTYFAMLHRDDGDRQFDYTNDLPIKDSSGNVVAMKFTPTGIGGQNTADWKTYRNEEYGFEVKYPGFLMTEYNKYENTDKYTKKYSKDEYFTIFSPAGKSHLTIWSQLRSYDITEALARYEPLGAESQGKVIIGGKEAEKFFTDSPMIEPNESSPQLGPSSIYIVYLIFLDKNRAIEIQYSGNEGEKEIPGLFNQILSTFKFTK